MREFVQSFFKKKYSYNSVAIVIALYYALVFNFPVLFRIKEILGGLESYSLLFLISVPFFFFFVLSFLFNLLSWPYITKAVFIFLIVTSSVVLYGTVNYGVYFDSGMVENVAETNLIESTSYISFYSIAWIFLIGIIPSIILFKTKLTVGDRLIKFIFSKLLILSFSLIGVLIIAFFCYKDYSSVGRNNAYLVKMIIPTQYINSGFKYVNENYLSRPGAYKEIGLDAYIKDKEKDVKPTLFVFMLGETARAENFEVLGYSRPTNPFTKKYDLIPFKNVSSCGTATAVSVPCMFSQLQKDDYSKSRANSQDNLLDIMKRAGVSLLWLENDGGDKGVARNIENIEVDHDVVDDQCNGSTCYDMELLNELEKHIDKNMDGDQFAVLHLIGSHGPTYYQRYPKEMTFFQPVCDRSDIENCSSEQIVNTYDNTIRYTDYVLSETIKKLKSYEHRYNVALFFISDHGESLGESGLYLHGTPYKFAPEQQTHVPMLAWFSEGFFEKKGIDMQCLRKKAENGQFSQDNIFDSMLGIMDIQTEARDPKRDLFSTCR
ncbi:phosphoethanolamine transferase [Endozoicomonas numazuensis]|uniref:Hydrolase n=1 Tax=Endozoicomonas numazuensis TaxID=1137799 RepID=A0A081NDQ1_9GAMM|nr:phosphoethanolamine--lipid A transferase [Endozoicomonas numazuensis]KEQ16574.1 hydrolase [Endozoicomonas numazuensis]